MKRLLISTTALSVALSSVPPVPLFAQTAVQIDGQTVICLPNKQAECPEGALCVVAKNPANCEGNARKMLNRAAGAAQPTDDAAAEAEATQKAAEEAAAAEAKAAKKAAREAAAAEKAAEEAAAAEAAAAQKAAEEAAAAQADPPASDDATTTEAEAVKPAGKPGKKPGKKPVGTEEIVVVPAEGVEAPPAEAVEALSDILTAEPEAEPAADGGDAAGGAAEAADAAADAAPKSGKTRPRKPLAAEVKPDAEPAADATVLKVTEADARASDEDFETQAISPEGLAADGAVAEADPTRPAAKKRDKLSSLEKFGLVVLGGLVVGSLLKNGDRVVSNTGDRVVVQRDDGSYTVLRDDDTLLRQPGSTVRTETFDDGSTRTTVEREDGSKIVTIRDASGRVLRRVKVDRDGSQVLLIDDLAPVERVDVSTLPKLPPEGRVIPTTGDDAALRAALAAIEAGETNRAFSLRQIRDYRQVRALAPTMDVENVTFATGSAAIRSTEAEKLARLGRLMTTLIEKNPAEMFLIEGHTDAVGGAAYNLALSDRRAESLALALTEYFGVPPENMVVQGYGETELRIQSEGDEPRNRRAVVRMISPLLQRLAAN